MAEVQRRLSLRVFLSSPGDVFEERGLARQILTSLPQEPQFNGRVVLDEVSGDNPDATVAMSAHLTPQEAINQQRPKPSECDVVVVILWARMGTPLPPEHPKPDGTAYLSGTEWEYLDALEAADRGGSPVILVYWRQERVLLVPDDPNFQEDTAQRHKVKEFFAAFRNSDGSFRRSFQSYGTPSEFAASLEDQLREIIWNRLGSSGVTRTQKASPIEVPGETLAWEGSPYPGLRAFSSDEAAIFFGRGREIDGLVRRVTRQPFTAVIGASGSGKSSLVAAGLLPRLELGATGGGCHWTWVRFSPAEVGEDPFMALAVGLAHRFDRPAWAPRDLAAQLRGGEDALVAIVDEALVGRPESSQLLLLIDQFEELFTLVDQKCRAGFIALVATAARCRRVSVVVTLRADFYAQCIQWEPLANLLRDGSFPLSPPGAVALAEMISRPAKMAGLEFEEGLVDRIVTETGTEPGALALMEFALYKLYESRTGTKLTRTAYTRLNGVAGAIEAKAEAEVYRNGGSVDQATLNQVFRTLVAVNLDGAVVRRRANLERFSEPARALVNRLVEARLLVSGDGDNQSASIEVAHEALLQHWSRLRTWVEQNRDFLLWQQRLAAAVGNWERMDQDPGTLLRGAPLKEAMRWLAERGDDIGESEIKFVRSSRIARDHRQRLGWSAVAVSLVAAVAVGIWSYLETSRRQRERAPILPEMIIMEPGSFMMGSSPESDAESKSEEQPIHEVTIERRFEIGKYELSFAEYDRFTAATGRRPPNDNGWGGGNRPVINVSWQEAVAFTEWLSEETGLRYRLPTEAEWEYAARANSSTRFWWGNNVETNRANCRGCGSEWDGKETAPAGSFEANAAGLHDTAGNVFEWVQDCWHVNYQHAPTNGSARLQADPRDCQRRVIRGGSYLNIPTWLRSANREGELADYGDIYLGFRLARDM